VIASTDQAIQNDLNRLSTQTLTTSDINNQAEYSAEAASINVGGGSQGGIPTLSGAGTSSEQGKASSVTVSAISQGTVSITDPAQRIASTGNDAVTTIAILNRDVKINENGETVDSQAHSMASTIAPIFDKQKIEKQLQAQVRITQEFSQQAPIALASFAKNIIQPYQAATNALKEAETQVATETDSDKQTQLQNIIIQSKQTISENQDIYDKWKENGDYRMASNIIIAAISGGQSSAADAISKEALSWAAGQMRQAMIEDSRKFPGICVSENDCISNISGKSIGANGDNIKVAGGRVVLETWCEKGGVNACQKDLTTKSGYAENPDGTVIFKPVDSNGNSLSISQFFDQHQELRSPLGGVQGGAGQMNLFGIQFEYVAGSFWDKLAEAYAGTHDTLNSFIWYDALGNGKYLSKTLIGRIGDATNIMNVAIATPFALSVLLPPEVWNAILLSTKR
jgi:filamentous hemagglutinin